MTPNFFKVRAFFMRKLLKPEADALRIVCTNSDTLTEWRITVVTFGTPYCMKYCFQLHLLVVLTGRTVH